jgi:flagellar basal body-associated protein FliL
MSITTPTNPTNGRTADEVPTMPVPEPPQKSGKRIVIASVVVALLALIGAAVTVVLVTRNTTTVAKAKANPVTVYQQKLSTALAPVVTGNRAVSVSLQALDGSKTTIRAVKVATTNAQQALTAARGAVATITVPPTSTQLSQQAAQALTQENGYLQSVSTTLGDPTGNTVASVQPLASATSSAFVPLASVAPGASASIYGVDNLLSWTKGARRQVKPTQLVIPPVPQTPQVTPPAVVVPDGGTRMVTDTAGRLTITAGSSISDGFARNILVAAANYYQANHVLPDGVSLSVSSPATGGSYNVSYSNDGSTVYATNLDASTASGNDVSFPASDANGTG